MEMLVQQWKINAKADICHHIEQMKGSQMRSVWVPFPNPPSGIQRRTVDMLLSQVVTHITNYQEKRWCEKRIKMQPPAESDKVEADFQTENQGCGAS